MHRSNSRRRRSIRAMATAMEGLESRRLLSAGGLIVHPNGGSDFETPHFSIDDVSHKEGDSGQTIYTFTITQTHNPLHQSDSLLVNTGDGTATVIDNDYEPIQGLTINFGPNDLVQQVSVSVNGDTRVEPDETFSLNLSDPQTTSGGFTPIIDDSQGVGTIENDDSPSAFSMSDVSHSEGNSGTTPFVFTLKRTSGLDRTDVVNYGSGDGTAEAPSDFSGVAGMLTFLPGQSSQTITVNVKGDTQVEMDETFFVTVLDSSFDRVAFAQGTIKNDDVAPATSKLAINDASKSEGDSGTSNLTFTVTRSGSTTGKSTVKYATANGSASSSSDYTAKTGTLTFNAGEKSKTITVSVKGDKTIESDETFKVNLSGATNATIADSSGTGTILNDDTSIKIADKSITEGNSGQKFVMVDVTLAKKSTKAVTVKYKTANSTAKSGSDYLSTSGTLTFAAGQTSKQIKVAILGDKTKESSEAFLINLTSAVNATIADGQGKVTITNDD